MSSNQQQARTTSQSSMGEGIDHHDSGIGTGVNGYVFCLNCFTDFQVIDARVGGETSCFYCGTIHVFSSVDPLDVKMKDASGQLSQSMRELYGEDV
ncbi:hypothetical protein HY469_03245 [Candidatus Roizmanbacteria bacterium]|nr:hypothetical protein [Candidatus Roizmanbacteria bacterium]